MRRKGFTLVETLVAMALVLFIMAIMSEAFVAGLESFRQLKAVGDMNQKLRGAATLIRADLRADHFGDRRPLSQQSLPPSQGFFRLYAGGPSTYEGSDPDGIPSTRAVSHMLHFTINLGGTLDSVLSAVPGANYLSAALPGSPLLNYSPAAYQDGTNYYSQWAEVAYFVQPAGTSTSAAPGATPLPLYALYRRQRLLYVQQPGQPDLNSGPNQVPSSLLGQHLNASCLPNPASPGFLHFNTPADLTAPVNRFGVVNSFDLSNLLSPVNAGIVSLGNSPSPSLPLPLPSLLASPSPALSPSPSPAVPSFTDGDLVLTDVISFEVKVSTGGDFVDLYDPALQSLIQNPAFQGPYAPKAFDTWSNLSGTWFDYSNWNLPGLTSSIPLKIQVRAVQITLRVWDHKAQRTRQVTLFQDL